LVFHKKERNERRINDLPANIENTLQAGIGVIIPTAKARLSAKLASVIDGPISAKALPTRISVGRYISCRFTACTMMHMLSTPTCFWIFSIKITDSE
jgi:hypothetical protein